MNKVLLTGRLTLDPQLRVTAGGRAVAQFALATREYAGGDKEKSEYHNVVVWGRLAEVCAQYVARGMEVAIEGRLQTRSWDDDTGRRHWKTEVIASSVEMLSPRAIKSFGDALAGATQEGDQA